MVIKKCLNCSNDFESKKSAKRKFCSKKCEGLYRQGQSSYWNCKDKIEVRCANCGKEEYVNESRSKSYVTCSKECLGEYNSKRYTLITMSKCVICGKEFETYNSKKRRRKTCSSKCRTSLRLKTVNKDKTDVRSLVENKLGITLRREQQIHHRDCDNNNDISNLVILDAGYHTLIHAVFGRAPLRSYATGNVALERLLYGCYGIYSSDEIKLFEKILTLTLEESAVVKLDEFRESLEIDNPEPSLEKDIEVSRKVQRIDSDQSKE